MPGASGFDNHGLVSLDFIFISVSEKKRKNFKYKILKKKKKKTENQRKMVLHVFNFIKNLCISLKLKKSSYILMLF